MTLRRVFVDAVQDELAVVRGPKAHHLKRVVRLGVGERVELSDSRYLYVAETLPGKGGEVRFKICSRSDPGPEPAPAILQLAVFKFARMELAIEKAVELGAAVIEPVVAARTPPALAAAVEKKADRWQRICEAAAEQSRRLSVPSIRQVRPFNEAIRSSGAGIRLLLDPDGAPVRRVLEELPHEAVCKDPLRLLVGPEGGWTEAEVDSARAAGYVSAGIGPAILRAETAALAALALALHWFSVPNR